MKLKIFIILFFVFLWRPAMAYDVEVTGTFEPTINNQFAAIQLITDDSQQLQCAIWSNCQVDGSFIRIPLNLAPQHDITAGAEARQAINFTFPQLPTLTLRHEETGHTYETQFFLYRMTLEEDRPFDIRNNGRPSPDCINAKMYQGNYIAVDGNQCGWSLKKDTPVDELPIFQSVLFESMFNLSALQLHGGLYRGEIRIPADFGDNYRRLDGNNNELVIAVMINVNHQLKMEPVSPDDLSVTLQPCPKGQICTPVQGEENWERWMVSRIPPVLTGRSNFNLSTSTKFIAWLDCPESIGPNCAIKSTKTGELVPVKTSLSLASSFNITNAENIPLSVDKDSARVLTPRIFRVEKGSFDFFVEQSDVSKMLDSPERPEVYEGSVSVILEPVI
ncbi:hypothetical protein [Cedecea neteri]|uniref:Fimbrial protein n=1 Tax=Cedecea neteri TaxID=158822 RepID=A0A291DW97_9ENTR|nr:hypothetical protein [Cedecea neteri]ATF91858.1 hypothetical protein CO704_07035 [Cedecea neteri]